MNRNGGNAKTFETGEYLVITGITKDQAGDYECSAENDASFPDMKKVKVTVNLLTSKSGTYDPIMTVLLRYRLFSSFCAQNLISPTPFNENWIVAFIVHAGDILHFSLASIKSYISVPPAILEMKHAGVGVGRTVLIRCETAAVPAPLFEWYKGERKLSNGRQGIIIQNYSTRSILTLSNMTEDHYGNYTCVAVNKLGTANASLPLIRKSCYT
ncbi:UNVERIFIED_CONTAM: hypothetical protein FKN15_048021 [Acipenser sinensis]